MGKTLLYLQCVRYCFAKRLYKKSRNLTIEGVRLSDLIDADMQRYKPMKLKNVSNSFLLTYLLIKNKVFRTQFYFRISQNKKLENSVSYELSKMLLKPMYNLQIGINRTGFVDGGLFIVHSSGCVISIHRAGKNLTVYQGVTMGDSGEMNEEGFKNPVLGDNVTVFANAVVAGGITIGNNVTVGAGSVVLGDVPDNCCVVGNPARIVKKDGQKVDIKL